LLDHVRRSDPRDLGTPIEKEWEEFRATYSAARLLGWILKELPEISPQYFKELQDRISWAIVQGEGRADEGEEDPSAPMQAADDSGATFMGLEDAYRLEEQLFPFRKYQGDFGDFARGLVLVGLHSACCVPQFDEALWEA
jgi:hypothetical protein